MIEDYTDRHIPFEGCFNFRDIGGYPAGDGRRVRWGRYYRAGRQDRMTEADLARLKDLGIRTQIDLRKPEEIRPSQAAGIWGQSCTGPSQVRSWSAPLGRETRKADCTAFRSETRSAFLALRLRESR